MKQPAVSPHWPQRPGKRASSKPALAAAVLILAFLVTASVTSSSEIQLRLTGDPEFPGAMRLTAGKEAIEKICFLGPSAKGAVDTAYLDTLAQSGVPVGAYTVSHALDGEKWPTRTFSANGALRLVPVSLSARENLKAAGKNGLAVHGRDFYPLAERMTHKPRMIAFYNEQLFSRLHTRWGTLRISNWDMGRLHDFYQRHIPGDAPWTAQVVNAQIGEIRKKCEPLKVRRKPGGPLE